MPIDVTGVSDIERLAEIFDQIVGVLDANGETHQFIGDADLQTLLARQFEMRHTTRQLGKRLHRTQRHSKTEQVQVVEHVSRINARHDLEAQHATGPLETFGSQTLVACAGQTRVMHRLNQRMHQQVAGDGIGKEVTPWAQKALEKAAEGVAEFDYENFDLGAERYLRDGAILPEEEEERIKKTDAILLGAVGDPRIKAGIVERVLLLKLRFDLDQYVNLRPSKLYKGVTSPLANPGDIDFVVVREGTEGLYCGAGGAVRRGTPNEVATEVSINTAYGVERVVRYAFQLAMKRRKHVTLVHKKNVLVNAGDMWQRIVDKVAEEYPEVSHDYLHIDATTIFMVSNPSRFDVILTDNLFGDIITDEAGAVVGGVGYSASGCINASNEYPSMFEPIHGSAPDIAGQNKANPTAAILSAAMLLRHLGFDEAAAKIDAAVEADIEELGSTTRSTDEVGRDILARM